MGEIRKIRIYFLYVLFLLRSKNFWLSIPTFFLRDWFFKLRFINQLIWLRLKISWLINWSTLCKKSLPLGLSAWRKVLFSWWARILPRKLSLIRAEKWKRRPLLHQESDLFPTLTLAPPYWRTKQFSLGGCRKSQGHAYKGVDEKSLVWTKAAH